MTARLVVLAGKDKGKDILLRENFEVKLGRSANCDLQISDISVSREHCYISNEDKTIFIEDRDSANGTFINGDRLLGKAAITNGDIVCLGKIELKLHSDNEFFSSRDTMNLADDNVIFRKDKMDATFSMGVLEPLIMQRNLLLLHEIGKLVQRKREILPLLTSLLEFIVPNIGSERGCVVIKKTQDNDSITVYHTEMADGFNNNPFTPNLPILNSALIKGQGSLSSDSTQEHKLKPKNPKKQSIHSIICVPLEGYDDILGAIYIDSTLQKTFSKADLDLLTAVGRQVGPAIERAFLEQQLVASEQHYRNICRSIIENSWDVLFRCNVDGTFQIISPSVKDLLGYSAEEILSDHTIWKKCIFPEDMKIFDKKERDVLTGESCINRFRVVTRKEEVIWVEETSYLVNQEDNSYIQGNVKDITKTKLLEDNLAQAQKMEAIGVLAGGVAHDLNNILGGVLAYPDLILMDLPEDSPHRECLIGIKRSGEHAAEVVKDLLTLARRQRYKMGPLDVNTVLQSYLNSLEFKSYHQKYPQVELQIALSEKPLMISGSSSHLSKVFMNLIINAIQAMLQGGNLKITSENTTFVVPQQDIKIGEYVAIKVEDTGQGIEEQDIDRIFEPFYSKKIKRGGTGLGLAVVYGVIKDHLGSITVDSQLGVGTSFTIYLPLKNYENLPDEDKKDTINMRGTESVLIVEDVDEQRRLTMKLLASLGYKVAAVTSGEEAVDYLSQIPVDLVILDMILETGMNGLETYKQILEIRPKQKAIIVSGFSNDEYVKETMGLGAGYYLPKPFTIEKLGFAVRTELDKN